jgi:hypothetical protein
MSAVHEDAPARLPHAHVPGEFGTWSVAVWAVVRAVVWTGVSAVVSLAPVSCSLIQTGEDAVDVQVGDLTLTRWDIDPDQYCLSLSIYNGTARSVKSFTVSARVDAPAAEDADDDETIAAPLQVTTETHISPDASRGVDIVFRSPLAFVPPEAITLSQIRFHSFQFDDDNVGGGEIVYPYSLREE